MKLFHASTMSTTWCQMHTRLASVKSLLTLARRSERGKVTSAAIGTRCDIDKTDVAMRPTSTCSSNQMLGQWPGRLAADLEPRKLHQSLTHRGLVRLTGDDSISFLNGLVTNDMHQFDEKRGHSVMYTLLLNSLGRVLYDLIVYRIKGDGDSPCFLIECDRAVLPELITLLKKYKIRKKVDLVDASDEVHVVAIFPENYTKALRVCNTSLSSDARPSILSCNRDPRLPSFGCRLLLPAHVKASSAIMNSTEVSDSDTYHIRRYMVGLPEGTTDFPPGNCTPLESNAVFLNGVSFTKGCYLGQELTARTHYTGVIRKRLIPITFTSESHCAKSGDTILTPNGKCCGKLRNAVGKHGLALLRVADVADHQGELLVKNADGETVGEVTARLPNWWPQRDDLIKDVLSSSDNTLRRP